MSDFNDDYVAAAAGPMLERFGEDVVYHPKGGTAVPRKAIIVRDEPSPIAGSAQGQAPMARIWLARDATLGVESIRPGGDSITFAPVAPNQTTQTYPTTRPRIDGPWWKLEINTKP